MSFNKQSVTLMRQIVIQIELLGWISLFSLHDPRSPDLSWQVISIEGDLELVKGELDNFEKAVNNKKKTQLDMPIRGIRPEDVHPRFYPGLAIGLPTNS